MVCSNSCSKRIIVAPSGAGKSYAAKRGKATDADLLPNVSLLYRALDAAFGARWWDRPDYDPAIRNLKRFAMRAALTTDLRRTTTTQPIATAEIEVIASLVEDGVLDRETFWSGCRQRTSLPQDNISGIQ